MESREEDTVMGEVAKTPKLFPFVQGRTAKVDAKEVWTKNMLDDLPGGIGLRACALRG